MLLHEILKYNSLQLVIGLEIDQTVTRKSFKHFGTQPHWDNDKVQWWYGDAAKSLLMLPTSYFGSFDLVLVDLSETVMSITVTDGLDIMAALGLLLKPEGILVKNEIYLEKLSEVFQHTLQLHFYDVPVICSQALIFASNSIDFFSRAQTDHDVDILWNKHLPKLGANGENTEYSAWHDYRYNSAYKKICKEDNKDVHDNDQEDEDDMLQQTKSPGILMILDIEYVNTIKSISHLVKEITNVLHDNIGGLNVLSSRFHLSNNNENEDNDNDNSMATIIMKEGYIVARTWPQYNYVAFDIHLWSAFELIDTIKQHLKLILNSNDHTQTSSSSYRIVAGGIFGASNWKNDDKKRGPWLTQSCNDHDDDDHNSNNNTYKEEDPVPVEELDVSSIINDMLIDDILFNSAVEESVSFITDHDVKVLVVCGQQGTPCEAKQKLSNHEYVDEVIEMWTCSDIIDDNDMNHGEIAKQMDECETKAIEFLKNETTIDELPSLVKLHDTDKLVIGDRILTTIPGLDQIVATVRAVNPNESLYVTFDNGFVMFNLNRRNIHRYLKKDSLFYQKKLRAIYIDPTVPYVMGRILFNIFDLEQNKKNFLKPNFSVISFLPEESSNDHHHDSNIGATSWRRNLLDRFRTDIVEHDPLFSANVLFKHLHGSQINMDITSSGDPLFIDNIKYVISNLDKYSLGAISSSVQFIKGGQFNFQPNFKATNFYLPKDYDQSSQLHQWTKQQSLGRQTIFQFERALTEETTRTVKEGERLKVGDAIEGNYLHQETWFEGTITKAHSDNTYNVIYEDGDVENHVTTSQLVKVVEVPLSSAPLTSSLITNAFKQALSSFTQICLSDDGEDNDHHQDNCSNNNNSDDDVVEFTNLGEGALLVAFWSNGNAMLLWDGRAHVDVNIFTYAESEDAHNMFVSRFMESTPSLQRTLTDTQPRGIGRVVNFKNDRVAHKLPAWA